MKEQQLFIVAGRGGRSLGFKCAGGRGILLVEVVIWDPRIFSLFVKKQDV